jgi:ADP-ribosyltransferase exoenzyme
MVSMLIRWSLGSATSIRVKGTALGFSWSRDLSTADWNSIFLWNRGGDALRANQYLRENDEIIVQFVLPDLDAVIAAGSFDESLVVYRGFAVPDGCRPRLAAGTRHTDQGYMSVSLKREHAEEFAARRAGLPWTTGNFPSISKTGDIPVVMELTLPSGIHAAELKDNGLDEYLLARSSTIQITGVQEGFSPAVLGANPVGYTASGEVLSRLQ